MSVTGSLGRGSSRCLPGGAGEEESCMQKDRQCTNPSLESLSRSSKLVAPTSTTSPSGAATATSKLVFVSASCTGLLLSVSLALGLHPGGNKSGWVTAGSMELNRFATESRNGDQSSVHPPSAPTSFMLEDLCSRRFNNAVQTMTDIRSASSWHGDPSPSLRSILLRPRESAVLSVLRRTQCASASRRRGGERVCSMR
eukprot:746504-Hanusia_phi.AAC.11